MRKDLLLFIIVGILLVITTILVVILMASNNKQPSVRKQPPIPVPTSLQEPDNFPGTATLFITSSNPPSGALNVSPETDIVFTFNKSVTQADVPFAVTPLFEYTTTADNNILTINPTTTLLPGTTYSVIIRFTDPINGVKLYEYSFTTEGSSPTPLPDTRPIDLINESNNYERVNHPDVFLSNQTPFSNTDFSVTSSFTSIPQGHFYFEVTLKGDQSSSRDSFLNWVRSHGLTNTQIQQLDIRYK